MGKKLTLSLDQRIIEKAKKYADQHNTSLSRLIESYLGSLTGNQLNEDDQFTPLVQSLCGVIELPADFKDKEEYLNHLSDKYQ